MGGLGGRPEGRGRPMDEYTASFLKPPSNPDPRSKVRVSSFSTPLTLAHLCSKLDPRSVDLGSGKVAGKVLIVDQYAGPAKILILLETALKWCCV